MSLVGARVVRKEDPNLISGKGQFVEDVRLSETVCMAFVATNDAHGRILSIDAREALTIPGVLGVWTAHDFTDHPDLPQGMEGFERPVLARDKVMWAGEPVAVVVAEDQYAAADGAAAVALDIEPLPAVTDVEAATSPDAPRLFEHHGSNIITAVPTNDDLERELQRSSGRATLELRNQRCVAAPIETMSVLADWKPGGLTLWASVQAPHHLRNQLAAWLDLPQTSCRVIAPDVGGGFGSKIVWYPELFIAPLLSKWLGRPVKFTQTRSEAMLQMAHGRDQSHRIDVGFRDDGTINALRLVVSQNLGAYPDPTGLGLPVLTTWMAAGCYRIPHVSVSHRTVVTNTTPVAAYRGAGRPEAAYAVERVVDLVAKRTGLDPTEVRRRNFIPPERFPYEVPHQPAVVYDSGDFAGALDECLRLFDYEGLKAERQLRRDRGSGKLLGIGFSSWLEIGGFGPNGSLEGFGHLGSWESAQVRVQPDGTAVVFTGASAHGQGHETTYAQIAADALGIAFEDVKVVHGDTDTVLQGVGTMGSRGVTTAGVGVHNAALLVLERAKKIAAHLLEANPADIEVNNSAFNVRGTPGRTVAWSDVAWASYQPLSLPEELTAGALEERLYQETPNFTYPSGCYACVVEVDPDTGAVDILRYVVVDDCGTVINPLLAEGQVHGGVAQGIAQALTEVVAYDEFGSNVTATFMDYGILTAADLPDYTAGRISTTCPNNPLGAKGIGESGAVGAPPAVVNAVVDALDPFGVDHLDMPLTPQRIWRAMHAPARPPEGTAP
ncbi:xanthine dehydrogenase family protein molybdopterin-binding subunit [Candidatus Poriferisocius sp.]|uniref:xanthine dehydrogenase family protein molybdopterin-binding subunit n=1 Tax=Candidatus Poriferisocius sp. TaxID=3101276 RepID=UPI003B5D032F